MVEVTVELTGGLHLDKVDKAFERAKLAAIEEMKNQVATNFEVGGRPTWPALADGSGRIPLQGTGKLKTACTDDAVVTADMDELVLEPGDGMDEIADYLHDKRPFMTVPEEELPKVKEAYLKTLYETLEEEF
jgi:hypothetical protein